MKLFKRNNNINIVEDSNAMSRTDFLKKSAIGALAFGVFGKTILKESTIANAATQISVSDNLTSSVIISDFAPTSTKVIWIDTSIGGVQKYYKNGAWIPTKAVWG